MSRRLLPLLTLALLLAAGCGSPEVVLEERWDQRPPLTVAVLPFAPPDTDEDTLDEVDFIRGKLAAELQTKSVVVLQPGWVDRRLESLGIAPDEVGAQDPARLAEGLGVDAVLFGEVEAIRNVSPLIGYYRSISATLRLVASDGAPLWRVEHTERETGGLIANTGQVLTGLIEQIENSSNLTFVQLAESWAVKVTERIPATSGQDLTRLQALVAPPEIEAFSASGGGAPGALVRFEMKAAAGLDTCVRFADGRELSLREGPEGVYRASYKIGPGDAVGMVTAIAHTPYGSEGRRSLETPIEPSSALRPPTGLGAEVAGDGVSLSWEGAAGATSYRVYRSDASSPIPTLVGETRELRYLDRGVEADVTYRYAVVAVDAAARRAASSSLEIQP